MATVRSICTDALMEIGIIQANETPSASDIQLALLRFQNQLDAWMAERAPLAIQKRVTFTLASGTSSVTIGPGGTVNTVRPTWLDTVNYVNPGSSPAQEVPVGIMTPDAYAGLTIKELPSALPLQCFYQTSTDTVLGTLFVYPQVTQDVEIVLYFPAGVGVPTAITDNVLAPPGYPEAFMYQLAERLLTPFGVKDPAIVQLVLKHSDESYARMKRPNLQPGQLGVDPALVGVGAGYNVYSDTYSGWTGR